MSQTSSFQVRTNTARRKRVKAMFARQGIPLSVAIEMFFAKAEERKGIPFTVQRGPEIPNAKTAKILDAILSDEKAGKVSRFDTMQEAIAQLRKEVL